MSNNRESTMSNNVNETMEKDMKVQNETKSSGDSKLEDALRLCSLNEHSASSSEHEVSIIETMASFLEALAGAPVDESVLRNMADSLKKRFCTSPGTLQDVTMENSYGIGYRSPCVNSQYFGGSTSPAVQGQSVREAEEQKAALRKENFNLKLRLFFLEENINGYHGTGEGQGSLTKQLVEKNVECEVLRAEIQEKQKLIEDAGIALQQLDDEQKEKESKNQAIIEELSQKIQALELERDMDQPHNIENFEALKKIRELEASIETYQEETIELRSEIEALRNTADERGNTIGLLTEQIKVINAQNDELKEEIKKKNRTSADDEIQSLRSELQQLRVELADKTCLLEEAQENLNTQMQMNEKSKQCISKLLSTIQALKSDNGSRSKRPLDCNNQSADDLNKENVTQSTSEVNTDCAALKRSTSDTEACRTESSRSNVKELEVLIQQQQKTITNLNAELKKKTANIQNLMNKELWEKNREIERLTKLVINKNSAGTAEDYLKLLERNKLLERKVEALVKNDEQNEKYIRECTNLCGMQTNRLVELAGFLNSLLKHKEVLGFLAADRRRAMRKAVDRSLDLSKSLNRTLSISRPSLGEHSLLQLSSLSDMIANMSAPNLEVNYDIDEEDVNECKTFNSHELQLKSIETLKAENKALKKELDKRRNSDVKKERRSVSAIQVDNQSESEAWSEPDRKVSMARIGLEDHSASFAGKDSSQQRGINATSTASAAAAAAADTDTESEAISLGPDTLSHSRNMKTRAQQEIISQLEQLVAQRDNRILEIQCELVDADNRLKQENLRVLEMTKEIEELRQHNEKMHSDLMAIGSHDDSGLFQDTSTLVNQIAEQTKLLESLQSERDRLEVEARVAEMHINDIKAEMKINEEKHAIALENLKQSERLKYENSLKEANENWQKRLQEEEETHKSTVQQLGVLQKKYLEAQANIDNLTEIETDLRKALNDSELSVRELNRKLNDSVLQATQAVMERTKVLNDKLLLEKSIETYKTELSTVSNERDCLKVSIEQLQRENQNLQNKLDIATATIKANMENSDRIKGNSNGGSDASHSGYTSEEVAPILKGDQIAKAASIKSNSNAAVAKRRLNNSSPDLGIESDAGRVSSVEIAQAQHSLLNTVEIPTGNLKGNDQDLDDEQLGNDENENPKNVKSFNGLNSANNQQHQHQQQQQLASDGTTNQPINHDCAKVERDFLDLQRKYAHTKRSYEDAYKKLCLYNQKKAQVEKDIRNQILKTHNVLKNVRSNMEN